MPIVTAGEPWMIREDALRAMLRTPLAGLVPNQPSNPRPAYPDRDTNDPGYYALDGVGVIPIHGPIHRHSVYFDDLMAWAFGGISVDRIADAVRAADADPEVRSLLLSIDSPGGQASGIGELAGIIRSTTKPIAAYAEFLCASAAYYLASATGEILAAPGALIGSIGVVIPLVDTTGFQEAIGIKDIPIVSSQSPKKWPDETTEEGRSEYQRIADDLANIFVRDVAKYRGVEAETVLSDFGQGAVFIASEAKKAGMIDRVGSFADAHRKMSGPNRNRLAKRSQVSASAIASPMRVRFVPQTRRA